MDIIISIFVFFFGAIWGSFISVVIHRLPKNLSLMTPSKCDNCGDSIPPYLNIPVIGFLVLLGKCRKCGTRIDVRYVFVEILTGIIALYLFPGIQEIQTSLGVLTFAFYFFVSLCLIIHFFIDLKYKILPDSVNLILAVLLFLYAFFNFHWSHWAAGFGVGFGVTYLITYAYYKFKGQIGLGGGDIKLFGALGFFLGPYGICLNIFFSCLLGSLIGVLLIATKKMNRESPLAFGPFIIIAASFQIFFPEYFTKVTKMIFGF